jgi:hypothetical protein
MPDEHTGAQGAPRVAGSRRDKDVVEPQSPLQICNQKSILKKAASKANRLDALLLTDVLNG